MWRVRTHRTQVNFFMKKPTKSWVGNQTDLRRMTVWTVKEPQDIFPSKWIRILCEKFQFWDQVGLVHDPPASGAGGMASLHYIPSLISCTWKHKLPTGVSVGWSRARWFEEHCTIPCLEKEKVSLMLQEHLRRNLQALGNLKCWILKRNERRRDWSLLVVTGFKTLLSETLYSV